jgi:hypothetical protein
MSAEDMGPPPDMVGQSLAPQLGTDSMDLGMGKTDMRRLTIIPRELLMPVMYGEIRSQKSQTWVTVLDVIKNWSVAIGGRGRRDIIRMEQVSRGGGGVNVEAEIEANKPNWVARNVYDRDWKDTKLREAGEIV